MLCFPETQKKAQEELDRVLNGRLPRFQGRKRFAVCRRAGQGGTAVEACYTLRYERE